MAEKYIFPTLPQISQFELQFAGPLIKDQQVDTFNDLLTLQSLYAYKHKIVWVIDEAVNYYLENGDGTTPINWKKAQTRATITLYDQDIVYQTGECVYISGKIYSATQQVPKFYSPLNNPSYWFCISGETVTVRYIFQNTPNFIIYTSIKNPQFEVMLCDFQLDGEGQIETDSETGLVIVLNEEIVETTIIRRPDLPPNNGIAYEVSFFVDDEIPTENLETYSGVVNIK
jgi:hypothetical protein